MHLRRRCSWPLRCSVQTERSGGWLYCARRAMVRDSIRGPRRTRLLDFRGSFTRDVESFGADFWGPGATGGRGWPASADYADLARLAHVSRARITQIMNLLLLAPDIQEAVLLLPRTDGGRGPIGERQVRPICAVLDWRKQRSMWGETVGSRDSGTGDAARRSTV